MRPEGPEVNRPGRQAGITLLCLISAEGAVLNQKRIASQIRFRGVGATQGVLVESRISDDAHVDCGYIQ